MTFEYRSKPHWTNHMNPIAEQICFRSVDTDNPNLLVPGGSGLDGLAVFGIVFGSIGNCNFGFELILIQNSAGSGLITICRAAQGILRKGTLKYCLLSGQIESHPVFY